MIGKVRAQPGNVTSGPGMDKTIPDTVHNSLVVRLHGTVTFDHDRQGRSRRGDQGDHWSPTRNSGGPDSSLAPPPLFRVKTGKV